MATLWPVREWGRLQEARQPAGGAHRLPDGPQDRRGQQEGSGQRGAEQRAVFLQVGAGDQDNEEGRGKVAQGNLWRWSGAAPRRAESGLTLVVIQHRTPNNERLMVDLLAEVTPLPIDTVEDGMPVKADHIYIAPAGKMLSTAEGRFVVGEPAAGEAALPIDIFFRSLASAWEQNAICVVLSGSGADETIGLTAVKEAGGLVVVQDPATAAFDSMLRSAIATGLADYGEYPEFRARRGGLTIRRSSPF